MVASHGQWMDRTSEWFVRQPPWNAAVRRAHATTAAGRRTRQRGRTTAPALHARFNRAASRLVDELAAGERVHETAHAGPSTHGGREEPTWPPSSTKTSRRS